MSEETPAGHGSLPLCSAILSKEPFLRRQPRKEIHKSFLPGPQRPLVASNALFLLKHIVCKIEYFYLRILFDMANEFCERMCYTRFILHGRLSPDVSEGA